MKGLLPITYICNNKILEEIMLCFCVLAVSFMISIIHNRVWDKIYSKHFVDRKLDNLRIWSIFQNS